jgi:hypothetical protein
MTVNKPQHCSVESRKHAHAWLVVCFGVVYLIGGCASHRRPVTTWQGAAVVRPIMPAIVVPRPAPPADESIDPVPELRLELPPPPALLAVSAVPARPHVAPEPTRESNVAAKPEPPAIAPQLSPAETNDARQQMITSLSVAESNLSRSQGKQLNSTQSDLASKIKGFITDARSAERDGDWTRARSLATKAQVLSEELVASL